MSLNNLDSRTWASAKFEILRSEIFVIFTILRTDYMYSDWFVKMNPYETAMKDIPPKAKTLDVRRASRSLLECFCGYDPKFEMEDKALDSWGRLCRLWIELTSDNDKTKIRTPFPLELSIDQMEEAKKAVLEKVEKIGIKTALHDMAVCIGRKRAEGGDVWSMVYFINRWRAWDVPEYADSKDDKYRKNKKEFRLVILRAEVPYAVQARAITTKQELFEYYGSDSMESLEIIAQENGLL